MIYPKKYQLQSFFFSSVVWVKPDSEIVLLLPEDGATRWWFCRAELVNRAQEMAYVHSRIGQSASPLEMANSSVGLNRLIIMQNLQSKFSGLHTSEGILKIRQRKHILGERRARQQNTLPRLLQLSKDPPPMLLIDMCASRGLEENLFAHEHGVRYQIIQPLQHCYHFQTYECILSYTNFFFNCCLISVRTFTTKQFQPIETPIRSNLLVLTHLIDRLNLKSRELSIKLDSHSSQLTIQASKTFLSRKLDPHRIIQKHAGFISSVVSTIQTTFSNQRDQEDQAKWEALYKRTCRYSCELSTGVGITQYEICRQKRAEYNSHLAFCCMVHQERMHQKKYRKILSAYGSSMPQMQQINLEPDWKGKCLRCLEKIKIQPRGNQNSHVYSRISFPPSSDERLTPQMTRQQCEAKFQNFKQIGQSKSYRVVGSTKQIKYQEMGRVTQSHENQEKYIKKYLVQRMSKNNYVLASEPEDDYVHQNMGLVQNEIEVLEEKLSKIISGAILKYYYDANGQTLYFDYCRYGNLKAYLKQTDKFISLYTKLWLIYNTCQALLLLEENGIFHGDIKTKNILVALGLWPKLRDFQTALRMDQLKKVSKKNIKGKTLPYAAPELFDQYSSYVDSRYDIYSFGMIMLEVFFLEVWQLIYVKMERKLWASDINQFDPYFFVQNFRNFQFLDRYGPRNLTHALFRLIKRCLSPNPMHRPRISLVKIELRGIMQILTSFFCEVETHSKQRAGVQLQNKKGIRKGIQYNGGCLYGQILPTKMLNNATSRCSTPYSPCM